MHLVFNEWINTLFQSSEKDYTDTATCGQSWLQLWGRGTGEPWNYWNHFSLLRWLTNSLILFVILVMQSINFRSKTFKLIVENSCSLLFNIVPQLSRVDTASWRIGSALIWPCWNRFSVGNMMLQNPYKLSNLIFLT